MEEQMPGGVGSPGRTDAGQRGLEVRLRGDAAGEKPAGQPVSSR